MGGLLNTSSTLMCPHGGTVQLVTSNTQVKAGGDFALRSSDTFIVSGCSFMLGNVYHPCTSVTWVQSALQSKAAGDSTLTEESVGLCQASDQAVQGSVLVNVTQEQVTGH
jgi:hypothetical protein